MPAKNYHLDKFHIISSTEAIVEDIVKLCRNMNNETFFYSNGKWSAAEHLEHLRLSFHKSWQGLFIPKFISRMMFKKPQEAPLPYEELQEKYELLLARGAKATKEYIPNLNNKRSKDEIIERFKHTANRYLNQVRYYWEEENIDQFQFPHPILGNITARELMYFNIFHSWHHYRSMKQRNGESIEL